jgi:hypothetical protein
VAARFSVHILTYKVSCLGAKNGSLVLTYSMLQLCT